MQARFFSQPCMLACPALPCMMTHELPSAPPPALLSHNNEPLLTLDTWQRHLAAFFSLVYCDPVK